jgi:hypothetical protein
MIFMAFPEVLAAVAEDGIAGRELRGPSTAGRRQIL